MDATILITYSEMADAVAQNAATRQPLVDERGQWEKSNTGRVHMTWIEFFEELAKLAPLGTASIALGAAVIALIAIFAQRDIAQRRAAIDFFLKTETDERMLALYETFKTEIRAVVHGAPMNTVVKSEHYGKVRSFLNLCELIAVGVRREAFSDQVSFHYWGDILRDAFRDSKPLIDYVRSERGEGGPATYCDLEWLCNKWRDRP